MLLSQSAQLFSYAASLYRVLARKKLLKYSCGLTCHRKRGGPPLFDHLARSLIYAVRLLTNNAKYVRFLPNHEGSSCKIMSDFYLIMQDHVRFLPNHARSCKIFT